MAQGVGITEMPETCPDPPVNYPAHSTEEFMRAIALYAIGFHLLHELAHSINPRGNFQMRHTMEQACDLDAAHWMLDDQDVDSEDGRARLIGAALALLLFSAETIDNNLAPGVTHPRCYQRLHDVVSEIASENVDVVWGFIASMVAMHMTNSNITVGQVPEGGFGNYKSLFESQCMAIHDHIEGG